MVCKKGFLQQQLDISMLGMCTFVTENSTGSKKSMQAKYSGWLGECAPQSIYCYWETTDFHSSLALSLIGEFTSAQERWLTLIWLNILCICMAILLAYPTGEERNMVCPRFRKVTRGHDAPNWLHPPVLTHLHLQPTAKSSVPPGRK